MQDTIYPVIICGGSGTRLWPASRPSRPKQLIALTGSQSLFQQTVARAAPLAGPGGQMIVVGGLCHGASIDEQLAALGIRAVVLLEPAARGSAPAMAVAAAWIARHDPDGVMAIVASDHHLPDEEAFRDAVRTAAVEARRGRIVTLGIRPTRPSTAYGYIKPTGPGLSAVVAFVEKPDSQTAVACMAEGYLWNSGNFIVSARTLTDELARHAPDVLRFAIAALPAAYEATTVLAEVFCRAPSISIDYAVMEDTRLASVLAVDFEWCDLGAWDSVMATGQGSRGLHVVEDAEGCLIRAPDGVVVAALGVRDLAIVVEADVVLVADLSRSQDVRRIVERVGAISARHLDVPKPESPSLPVLARRFADWLRLRALPTWATLGRTDRGMFREVLTLDVQPVARPRRARVQTRQIYVYALAGLLGWRGPWREAVTSGLATLRQDFVRPDGLCRTLVDEDGAPLDETVMVYDQAFAILALATAKQAGVEAPGLEVSAVAIREGLLARPSPHGGVPESGDHPFQANAHMHLLEACLGWEAAGGDAGWARLSDTIVDLALTHFIDARGGFLREFFAADWSPAPGVDGRLVEPGHQFEWAWLLTHYGRLRNDPRAHAAAARLYDAGRRGVSATPEFVFDALDDDGAVRSGGSRLWPHTEWLKAALILAEDAQGVARAALVEDARLALQTLWLYLTPDGVWRDKHLATGGFVDEPAPASSLYHIMVAFLQLTHSAGRIEDLEAVDLS